MSFFNIKVYVFRREGMGEMLQDAPGEVLLGGAMLGRISLG